MREKDTLSRASGCWGWVSDQVKEQADDHRKDEQADSEHCCCEHSFLHCSYGDPGPVFAALMLRAMVRAMAINRSSNPTSARPVRKTGGPGKKSPKSEALRLGLPPSMAGAVSKMRSRKSRGAKQ